MKCLNCGNECEDKFCPKCGQPTATARTTWRSFSTSSLADMLRFKGRFLHTCGELLIHPWTVISNYTAGRRVRYSSPLLFLLTLGIYSVLLTSWICPEEKIDHSTYIFRFYDFSSGMFTLFMLPPIILAARLAYRSHGARRFNIPELLTAGIFLSALSFIIDILLLPVNMMGFDTTTFSLIIFIAYSSVCIFKAFPVTPRWKAVMRFIWFLMLTAIFLCIYVAFFESIPQLMFGPHEALRQLLG